MKSFKIYKKQIPEELIDDFLATHQKFKNNKLSSFRAQGNTVFEKPILDKFDHQINSIHNPHLLIWNGLNKKTLKILHHQNIINCLHDFYDCKEDIVHFQSMFFDKSTATSLHQDTWYLDTKPKGRLVGVWIALEDIENSSGPFYVIDKTDSKPVSFDDYDFNDIDNDHQFRMDYPNAKKIKFLAKKGDILIWNSLLFHGAFRPEIESLTRKSLTSHFYLAKDKLQDPPVKRFMSIYDHLKPITTSHRELKLATTISPHFFSYVCFAMRFLGNKSSSLIAKDNQHNKKISDIRNL